MVWGCFADSGTSTLTIVDERMILAIYQDILDKNVLSPVQNLGLGLQLKVAAR